ncbi:hypothetical protein [Bacillus sp. NEB1478]|uniref:hypothetical protein n=1 Tax=Bacillus sp. NEB1478 TaxID=3073816 RepID=UPI002873C4AF|nr:hypothetical protein [Bacillus sp. NEB1478]WNB92536.1 hypothetical protein RGB74_02395 [Bacillus sp. NEB1478]
MNNFKRVLFISLAVLFIVFIGTPYLLKIIKNQNPALMNSAEQITLKRGDYIVKKDIEPGFYDITALTDNVSFMPFKLSKGDQILGLQLDKNTHVIIEGKGKVKLSPAKFETLKKPENEYVIDHSGNYLIGRQIPEGQYKISFNITSNKKIKEMPFIQLLPGYGKDPIKSLTFEKKSTQDIQLQTGNVLEVHKSMMEEYDHVVITLINQ